MIIKPLAVWVQNILPVVYDDSLSYLEIVAKVNAKTNEIISQTNENTHAIETLAETIAQLGDIEELRALLDEIEDIIENLYTTDVPLVDGTASAGSANHAARSDHVHPSDTSKAPVNHASNENTYGIGDATNYGHVKITDNINNADTGTAVKPSVVKTVNDKLSTFIRPNLLTNWYFVGGGSQQDSEQFPINQRGQAQYTGAGAIIDRWYCEGAGSAVLNSDYITFSGNGINFEQFFSKGKLLSIQNKTVTASLLLSNGELLTNSGIWPTPPEDGWSFEFLIATPNVRLIAGTNAQQDSIFFIQPQTADAVNIKAIKLELGTEQTLAHQESGVWTLNEIPDYGQELLKCQRYFQTFRTEALRPTYGTDCRPVMATDEPTKSTVTIGGVTYYTLES